MNADAGASRFFDARPATRPAGSAARRAPLERRLDTEGAARQAAAAALVAAAIRIDLPTAVRRRAAPRSDLPSAVRVGLTALVVAAHAAGSWALMQRTGAPPEVVPELALLQVEWIAPATRAELPAASPPSPRVPSLHKPAPAPRVVVSAGPAPAAPAFTTPVPTPAIAKATVVPAIAPAEVAAAVAPAALPSEPAPAVAQAAPGPALPATAPSAVPTIAPSAVRYLDPPAPVYPGASRRLAEAGRVVVRVLIDERGLPAQLLVQTSSGHRRLDESALAALRAARFVAHSEGGVAQRVWALVPIDFQLES